MSARPTPTSYRRAIDSTALRGALAEMPIYLPWLVARVGELGGEFTQRHVRSLHEVGAGADLVVNCAGLGARELIGDHAVYPVRGQIVRVTNPGLTMSVRDEQHPGGRAYVHPRRDDCILGGTLDEGRWDTTVDMAVGAAIIERCWDLVPGPARRTGARARRRAAPRPLDGPSRGGRAAQFRCASDTQLRARRSGSHAELGLRTRGNHARVSPSKARVAR